MFRLIAYTIFIAALLTASVVFAQEGRQALRIDSCKGECDRYNKHLGEWKTDIVPVPEGEQCTMHNAIDEAIRWLEVNRPGFLWAGSACIILKGQVF